jgi:two-component system, NarL family, response regulator NreC
MRILIADDSDVVRRGIIGLLSYEPEWVVCGEAKDGSEALQKARELLPDLVLLDISMPGLSGLDVARRLRQELPKAKLLVISQHDSSLMLPQVIEAGGDACLDKGHLATDLVATIKKLK